MTLGAVITFTHTASVIVIGPLALLAGDIRADATSADEQVALHEVVDRVAQRGERTLRWSARLTSLLSRLPATRLPSLIPCSTPVATWKYSGIGLLGSSGGLRSCPITRVELMAEFGEFLAAGHLSGEFFTQPIGTSPAANASASPGGGDVLENHALIV
jgi:hypothetical protein